VPRDQRLRGREIDAIFRQRGRREAAASVIALWRPRAGEGGVGFAVGRRLGGAVERNRARRRLREAYRLGRRGRPDGFDVVFVGRSALLNRSFSELCSDVVGVLRAVTRRSEVESDRGVEGSAG
jgi:ribonuclease P protein component